LRPLAYGERSAFLLESMPLASPCACLACRACLSVCLVLHHACLPPLQGAFVGLAGEEMRRAAEEYRLKEEELRALAESGDLLAVRQRPQ